MTKFVLKCVRNSHAPIPLPHLEPVLIGRSASTKIQDTKLSRKQIQLIADTSKKRIHCQILGYNRSKINDKTLGHCQSVQVKPGAKIDLLEGLYEHEISMESEPETEWLSPKSPPKAQNNHWSQGLYNSMQDPGLVVFKDDQICIVKDRYPKAKKHFLVLPIERITTLYDLGADHLPLVNLMVKAAREKIVLNHPEFTFKMGFHAIPSMAQVHMHVISQDFDSDCLKNKKHWNSFNTDYFIPCEKVLDLLKTCGNVQNCQNGDKKDLLGKDLVCNQCSFKPKNMPDLKKHLKTHLKG